MFLDRLFFAEKDILWLLLIVPIAIYFIFFRERKNYSSLVFSNVKAIKLASQNSLSWLRFTPDILRILALIILILALAKPKFKDSTTEIEVTGIDIAFVLDISTSMAAADFLPKDRLNVAKEVISDFVHKRKNDRVALVVFNALTYIQAPLTLDHNIFDTLLKALSMDDIRKKVDVGILQDGTAIGNALATAVDRLKDTDTKSKIIILLTDGSNNKGNITPMKAADMAKKANIKIYTILVGKKGKVPYPVGYDILGNPSYKNVNNSVNPDLLKKIAKTTGATFHSAKNREDLEKDLSDIMDHLERSRFNEANFDNLKTSFHLFLIIALFLLFLDMLLRVTRFKRFP